MTLTPNSLYAGRYRLMKRIGLGGFSEVWLAADELTEDLECALKIYAPERGLDDLGLNQFKKEYRVSDNLNHPGLLKAKYFDIFEGSPYLVMAFCKNGSLSSLLASKGMFSQKEIAEAMVQLGDALAYLHEEGVIHQDIKPDNVLINDRGKYLITDFGISSRMRSTLRKSTTTSNALTIAYAPPERFNAKQESIPEGDIFSLGVMIYELATGDVPWMGAGGSILKADAELPELPDHYSKGLTSLMQRCLAYNPKLRVTAAEIRDAAEEYLSTGSWPKLPVIKMTEEIPRVEPVPETTATENSAGAASSIAQGAIPGPEVVERVVERGSNKLVVTLILLVVILAGGLGYAMYDNGTFGEIASLNTDEGDTPAALAADTTSADTTARYSESIEEEEIKTEPEGEKKVSEPEVDPGLEAKRADFNRIVAEGDRFKDAGELRLAMSKYREASVIFPGKTIVAQKLLNTQNALDAFISDSTMSARLSKKARSESKKDSILRVKREARLLADENIIRHLALDFVFIEGGQFAMGCTSEQADFCKEYEKEAHLVSISGFSLGRREVTQAQWRAVMGKDEARRFSGCEECPVVNVSWIDIKNFIRKLETKTGKSFRLPTEAEWEYAARGGKNGGAYIYSGGDVLSAVAQNGVVKLQPVGMKRPNKLGLYDMSGNVWEWCSDWYGPYISSAQSNPKGPSSAMANAAGRVIRGGSWNTSATSCRVSERNFKRESDYSDTIGFRLVAGR